MNTKNQRLLVLYSRLPGYMFACLRELVSLGWEVHVVKKEKDPLAPFQLSTEHGITFYNRADYSTSQLEALGKQLSPSAILMSGWSDRSYLRLAGNMMRNGLPVIMGMDNQWKGSFRQRVATLFSGLLVRKYVSHIWVPGRRQYEFARRLGFRPRQILVHWYSADTAIFGCPDPLGKVPRRFIFAGRLVPEKGIEELRLLAHKALAIPGLQDWHFLVIGSGPMAESLANLPNVTTKPFLQPEALAHEASKGGIFLLPSRSEPWGVVVHEFAASGFPLLLSSEVGAADSFLIEGYNGFMFEAGNSHHLVVKAAYMASLPPDQLQEMAMRSAQIGNTITPKAWAAIFSEACRA